MDGVAGVMTRVSARKTNAVPSGNRKIAPFSVSSTEMALGLETTALASFGKAKLL
jgi:hypothetical protein